MTFDINKADLVDTTHVDAALASIRRNEENARRRAMVLTWSRAVLLGGIGVVAIIAAAALFGLHPEGDRDYASGREAGHRREAGDRRKAGGRA